MAEKGERERILTDLSMDNHHPSTQLSMDPGGGTTSSLLSPNDEWERELDLLIPLQTTLLGPPYTDLALSAELSDCYREPLDILDVDLGPNIPKAGPRKATKRVDNIWGAWFFFSFYFKPVLSEEFNAKLTCDSSGVSGFDKSYLKTDAFLVQNDMENMYMWVFKEQPENALGKMQLRSYMNGHSWPGEPQFPFSVDKGFTRSHRMQRKKYRGLSNPQCIHGIEVVRSPNMAVLPKSDCLKWVELTGRDLNFTIPPEASDFELERSPLVPFPKTTTAQRKLLNRSGLNLSTQLSNHSGADGLDPSPVGNKRKKDFFPENVTDENFCSLINPCSSDGAHDMDNDIHPVEPAWLNEFSGVMRDTYGPVTAAKTIYEDEEGYLIMISFSFSDQRKVKVSWRNDCTHGVVKILCVSTARMPYVKRCSRTFKLTDPSPEHCPPGEFVREISLPTRIPEDANLEAYCDETGSVLEIKVPKPRVGPVEHEVQVYMRPRLGGNELLLS